MKLILNRNGGTFIELPDEPMFYQSFNYREVIAIYPEFSCEGEEDKYTIYCAEGGHVYNSGLTLKQIKEAITGESGLMGNLQKRAFYILIHDSGYGTPITAAEFRNHYCAKVSKVTPPNVYINCADFDGVQPEKEKHELNKGN